MMMIGWVRKVESANECQSEHSPKQQIKDSHADRKRSQMALPDAEFESAPDQVTPCDTWDRKG